MAVLIAPTRAEGGSESINGGSISHYNPNTKKGASLYFDSNGTIKYKGSEIASVANNNTWTGANYFNTEIRVPTVANNDNTTRAVSTAYIKNLFNNNSRRIAMGMSFCRAVYVYNGFQLIPHPNLVAYVIMI